MGSNSSSCNNGDWVGTEKIRCSHNEYKKKVKRVAIRSCKFLNGFVQGSAATAKWLTYISTFGIAAAVNGGIKNPTHDFVQLDTHCDICGENRYITVEFNNDYGGSKYFTYGYYKNDYGEKKGYKPNYLTVGKAREVFKDTYKGSYSLVNNNCAHFASRYYYNL